MKLKNPGVQGDGCAVSVGIDSVRNDDCHVVERKSTNLQCAWGSGQEERRELLPGGASKAGAAKVLGSFKEQGERNTGLGAETRRRRTPATPLVRR